MLAKPENETVVANSDQSRMSRLLLRNRGNTVTERKLPPFMNPGLAAGRPE